MLLSIVINSINFKAHNLLRYMFTVLVTETTDDRMLVVLTTPGHCRRHLSNTTVEITTWTAQRTIQGHPAWITLTLTTV